MNLPPVIVLGILAFAAGWGIDAGLGRREDAGGHGGPRIPVMARGVPSGSAGTGGQTSAAGESRTELPPAKTLADLQRLIKGVPWSTGRARAGTAIGRLTAEELAAVAGELLASPAEDRGEVEFPSQITNPLLRRWLALAPMEALRFYRDAGQRMDHGVEVSGSYLAAIQAAFRAHPEEVWEIAAKTREGFDGPNKACLEALKDVPPGEAMKQMAALGTYAGIWRAYPDYLGDLPARWIGSDPQQAMKWALALPVNYRRSDLVSRLWMMWVARDGQAAQAWFDGAPPGLLPPGKLRTYLRDFIHK